MSSTTCFDHTVVSIIGTTFTVALHAPTAPSKIRRAEDPKGDAKTITDARYAAGAPAVAGVLDRAERGPAASARVELAISISRLRSFVSPFGSSNLRIFDVSRRRAQR
jgi:hypothetical protein